MAIMLPSDPIPAARYLSLGDTYFALQHEKGNPLPWVQGHLSSFVSTMDLLGFNYPKDTVANFASWVDQWGETARPEQLKQGFPEAEAIELLRIMKPIVETITKEAEKRLTIVLSTDLLTVRLRDLENKLNDSQKRLLEETARCLECGAYRSGAVMGWNVAYDYIRQWVFDNKLGDFNNALTSNYMKKGQPLYQAIKDYDDFEDGPQEKIVLETCFIANIFGGKIHDELRQHLRTRNTYAHPTDKVPSANTVNGYIEHLVDIITRKPFA
jgi:hypothetical protein